MSASSTLLGVAVLLLQLWATLSFPSSGCPVPCLCRNNLVLNCSSLGLTRIPKPFPEGAVSLNISNNSLGPLVFAQVQLKWLRYLWVDRNGLESLSLMEKSTSTLLSGEHECTSWTPDLRMLSAEQNHLKYLPKGLGCMKLLQILQLSHNQISEISLSDLHKCHHLKELHLEHNSITTIHPRAFQDLKQLKVLNLRYNLLATIPNTAYQSLQNLNALVEVSFNRWHCDCKLNILRKWIRHDTERGDTSWQVLCSSPPRHAGKSLIHLEELEHMCRRSQHSTTGHYHNMIVNEGMKITIPCSNYSKDIMNVHWWTPNGQTTENLHELLIEDTTEKHSGLYICTSGVQGEHISVYDLQVYKKGSGSRLRREAENILDNGFLRQSVRTQSDFVLAVCLSVIITFILAFILGVLLRPLLEKIWRRIRHKGESKSTSTSSSEPQPYLNEGYSDYSEDQDQEVRVGSRVTFGGITEVESQVPCYATVENEQSDDFSERSIEAEGVYEVVEENQSSFSKGNQSALEVESHRGSADPTSKSSQEVIHPLKPELGSAENMEFEPIPNENQVSEVKRKGSSSTSSLSSQESTFLKEQSVDPSPLTIIEVPGFTKEPFSEWPAKNFGDIDPELWNESGESFSFTDGSERSSIPDFSSSALTETMTVEGKLQQDKLESPPVTKNIDSDDFEKLFGKIIDNRKPFELSDTESSSSSSQSGESSGGTNKYSVNPEVEIEQMPSAGILTRQETIILEPSDVYLTFTHGESVDEGMLSDSFGSDEHVNIVDRLNMFENLSFETLPKVKRYVQFKQSTHHSAHKSIPPISPSSQNIISKEVIESEAKTDVFKEVSPDAFQKVKRYINFEVTGHHCHSLPSSSITKKENPSRSQEYTSSSEDDETQPTAEENYFFRTIDLSSEELSQVKRHISFKQVETSSRPKTETSTIVPATPVEYSSSSTVERIEQERNYSSLPSSPINVLSGKKSKFKKRKDQSFYGSHESLPLYYVHPVYRSNINRLNRGYDTDASISSEDDDQFTEYPRKLEFMVAPGLSTFPDDTKDIVLNIDFDNSSSSTDVLDRKQSKGLLRLRALGARWFNRHENNTDQRSPGAGWDNERASGVSSIKQSKLTKKQATYKDFINGKSLSLDHLPKVKRYIQFSHQLPSPPQTTGMVSPDLKGTSDSRRTSSSSEDEVILKVQKEQVEAPNATGNIIWRPLDLSTIPKLKRHVQFAEFRPPYPNLLTSSPSTEVTAQIKTEGNVQRSTKDGTCLMLTEVSPGNIQKVKRYIEFQKSKPLSQTLQSSLTKKDAIIETRKYSSSSEDDAKIMTEEENFKGPVKRYIAFKALEQPSPVQSVSSPPAVKSVVTTTSKDDISSGNYRDDFVEKVSVVGIPRVKRYIQFKKPESDTSTESLPSTSNSLLVIPGMNGNSQTRRSSSSTESDYIPKDEDDHVFRKTGGTLEGIPRVKRYIQFKHPESSSSERVIVPVEDKETKSTNWDTSSEEEYKPSTKEDIAKTNLSQIPKVKRYVAFKQSEQFISHMTAESPSTTVQSEMGTVIRQSVTTESSSSEDDDVEDRGAYLDSVPIVKRYIAFRQTNTSTPVSSERNNIVLMPKEPRKSSTSSDSSEEEAILSANKKVTDEEFLVEIPKVKRYIQFQQSKPPSSDLSPTSPSSTVKSIKVIETELKQPISSVSNSSVRDLQEDDGNRNIGVILNRVPRITRYLQFTHPENQVSAQTSPSVSSERVIASVVDKKARRWSTSSEEDVQEDNYIGQKETYLDRVPRVKRYLQFKETESLISTQTPPSVSSKTATASAVNKETIRWSTSSKEDVQKDYSFQQTEAFRDKIPKVKRYIQFTHPENQISVQRIPVPPERINKLLVQPGIPNKALEDKNESNITVGHKYSEKIPKVKRYIRFTKYEPYSSAEEQLASSFGESIKRVSADLMANKPSADPPSYRLHLEYLREHSEVRQRQERRRVLQQRRMDELVAESLSSLQQNDVKQQSSLPDNGIEPTNYSSSSRNRPSRTEVTELPVLRGLKTKSTLTLGSMTSTSTTKDKEYLI